MNSVHLSVTTFTLVAFIILAFPWLAECGYLGVMDKAHLMIIQCVVCVVTHENAVCCIPCRYRGEMLARFRFEPVDIVTRARAGRYPISSG